jgi:hypothetical protein
MVLFLAGVVNPSGLEISSAIAVWMTGVVLVTEHLAGPPKGLVGGCPEFRRTSVAAR